jgi:putative inorganic carbon (HCO3(-)) transporter
VRSSRLEIGLLITLTLGLTTVAIAAASVAAPHLSADSRAFEIVALGAAGVLALFVAAIALPPAWLLSIGLGLSIFSGNWKYMHIPVPLDRAVTIIGIAAVLLRPRFVPDAPKLETRRLHWLLAVLSLYAIVSAALAGTFFQQTAFYALLDRLGIEPFVLFLVAPVAFATARERRILLGMLVVVGAYLGVLGIFEVIGPHSLEFPSYIGNPNLGQHYGRARGPFLEAGADGLSMFISAVACFMLIAEGCGKNVRRLLIAVIVLCVLGIVLCETRQVWLGAAIGAIVAAALSPRMRRYIPVGILLAAALVGAVYFGVPGLQAKLKSRTNDQRSLWDRENSDAAALRMFEARPLLGFGWFEFGEKGGRYYHVARDYPLTSVGEVHNVALSNAAELGFVGVGLWLIAVLIAMVSPFRGRGPPELRPWALATAAIGIAWFIQSNFAPVTYAFDNYVPWVFAALAYGRVSARLRSHQEPVRELAVPLPNIEIAY